MRFAMLLSFLLISGPTLWAEDIPRVVVTGLGEISVPPDVAYITLGVSYGSIDADSALNEVGSRVEDVFEVLREEGVREEDVEASGLRLEPENTATNQMLFRASNEIRVRVFELAAVGRILTEAVANGANALGRWETEVRFDVLDRKALAAEARQDAVKDALENGRVLAEAAGVRLGPIREIKDGARRAGEFARANVRAPAAPGQINVSWQVTVTFDLLN